MKAMIEMSGVMDHDTSSDDDEMMDDSDEVSYAGKTTFI